MIKAVDKYSKDKSIKTLKEHRSHSLKYLPEYPDKMGRQKYLGNSVYSSTLAKFRLGNANLGNKESPAILVCPCCQAGPNNELHLVLECKAMAHLKQDMQHILDEAIDQQRFALTDYRKL